jgi:tetratricopeptide (TPR) repeat protein
MSPPGDEPPSERDSRFLAFLEVAASSDSPDDISASIKAGLTRQYDRPPVAAAEAVLRQNCTPDRLRQLIYWPNKDDAELYPGLIRGAPPGAPDDHPARRTQITFLMSMFLKHSKDRCFVESFICAGGLGALVPLLRHENLHLRGQAIETFSLLTDETVFPWHEPPRESSSRDKAMHARMLELAKSKLIQNLTANILPPENEPTFPGGSGHALRVFAFFLSWLRVRHSGEHVLRLSFELLGVLQTVSETDHEKSEKYSERDVQLAKTLFEDFSRFGEAAEKKGDANDAEPSTENPTPKPLPEAHENTTQVVLGMRVTDSVTVSEGSHDAVSKTERTENTADAGEGFKKRGNGFYEKKKYTDAIEQYSHAIDAPVSYHRLFDEAPRRAVYHLNRAACYLARGGSYDAGVLSSDTFGVLESRSFGDFCGGKHTHSNSALLESSIAHAEAALMDCESALEMQGGNTKAIFRKAISLWRLGRADEAAAHAEKALLSASDDADESEARLLMTQLKTPYVHPSVQGVLEACYTSEKEKESYQERDSSEVPMGIQSRENSSSKHSVETVLAASLSSLSPAEETARANFVSGNASLMFGSNLNSESDNTGDGTTAAAVNAIGEEGDELYDLD